MKGAQTDRISLINDQYKKLGEFWPFFAPNPSHFSRAIWFQFTVYNIPTSTYLHVGALLERNSSGVTKPKSLEIIPFKIPLVEDHNFEKALFSIRCFLTLAIFILILVTFAKKGTIAEFLSFRTLRDVALQSTIIVLQTTNLYNTFYWSQLWPTKAIDID